MVRMTFSISVPPDLGALLKAYSGEGGNISGLVSRLLRMHFGQGGGGPNMSGAMSAELAGRISEVQSEIARLTADMERFRTYADEAKKAEEKKRGEIEEAIRSAFSEMESGGLEGWRSEASGTEISRYAGVRAGLLAARLHVSEEAIRAAILGIYPDLEGYL